MNADHILNLNLNQFLYVYFETVKNGSIQLVSLDLQSFDGGEAAKWVTHLESSGFTTIRPALDQSYAVTVNQENSSVELKPFVKGDINQEWTFVSA